MGRLFYILFLALLPFGLSAQKVKWETTAVSFGTVGDWNSPPATFSFKNTGNDKLMFLPQRHDREVLVRYPNRAIQPGETGEITIQYYTGKTGPFSRSIEVFSNASNKAEKLTVRGNIKSIYANALTACPSFQNPAPVKKGEPNVIQVVDAATNRPIPNASVEVFDRGIRKATNGTNMEGVTVNWIALGKYVVVASKSGYEKGEQEIAFTKRNRIQVVYLNRKAARPELDQEEIVALDHRRGESEPIDLGVSTNDVLENENNQVVEQIDLGITTNEVFAEEPIEQQSEQIGEFDLGISSNEQWGEHVTIPQEDKEPIEELAEEVFDLGIATNDQLDEELVAEVQLSIEEQVEAALAESEVTEVQQEVEPEHEFSSTKYRPNNVLLLLDVSGSMKDDDKMDKLKSSIRRLVLMLREVDVLTMIAYNSTSWEVLPPTPVTDNQAIVTLVDSLQASGYTNGVNGMEAAYESLEKQLIAGGNNQLIIATDGKFNSSKFSEKDALQMVKDNSDKGIVLSIIGFGDDKEAGRLMRKLANLGGGNFLQVKNNEDPTELLAEEIKNRSRISVETD
jgi:Ca-activated chloride channel family protein